MAIPADYAEFCELIEDDEANPGPTIGQWDLLVEPVWRYHPFVRTRFTAPDLDDRTTDSLALRRCAILWRLSGPEIFKLLVKVAFEVRALKVALDRAVSEEHKEALKFELENVTSGWEWPRE